MTRRRRHAAWTWLTKVHPTPDHAHKLLLRYGRASLPTGALWDVVQVPEMTGLDALKQVRGPAFRDVSRSAVLFLVPTTGGWGMQGTAYLTDGTMVCTPAPDVTTPLFSAPPLLYWLTPPDGSGTLVDPADLFEVLAPLDPAKEGPIWCGLCGRTGPTTVTHRPSPNGGGTHVPAHEACVIAGIVDGRVVHHLDPGDQP
ncbi:hypothetical protein RND61_13830 [Streptomyces sp. TRM76323]|uniref:DNA primase/polymerase bifunctional N-terminal domain-containing protein n=1 Tax=Streptomyces tamarix TaxID=3078565 RepID=A0ABU3QK50_9ACTN|nr:hypothetical protein [Streptomyces tamarix]MDT9683144.1 hypothetical protein [Streptomyces tamarix]